MMKMKTRERVATNLLTKLKDTSNNFQNLYLNNDIHERIENIFSYKQEEIEIRVESMKCELNNLKLEAKRELKSRKRQLKKRNYKLHLKQQNFYSNIKSYSQTVAALDSNIIGKNLKILWNETEIFKNILSMLSIRYLTITPQLLPDIIMSDIGSVNFSIRDLKLGISVTNLARAIQKLQYDRKSFLELKTYRKPPKQLENLAHAVCVLYGVEPSWEAFRLMISNRFDYTLEPTDSVVITQDEVKYLTDLFTSRDFNLKRLENVSKSSTVFYKWLENIYKRCVITDQNVSNDYSTENYKVKIDLKARYKRTYMIQYIAESRL